MPLLHARDAGWLTRYQQALSCAAVTAGQRTRSERRCPPSRALRPRAGQATREMLQTDYFPWCLSTGPSARRRAQCSIQSNARHLFHHYADKHIERWTLPLEEGCGPLPVPATSVYSRLDGLVAWRACIDRPSPLAENVEVRASHLGFGHHPAVPWLVADRLAQPRDAWTPLRPPRFSELAHPRPVRDP
jgi:hypothetical protein